MWHWVSTLALLALTGPRPALAAPPPDIPRLSWEERSDWTNVKTDVTPPAKGDGQADDTGAIQAALDKVPGGTAVYLPAGIYRITRTLVLNGPVIGALLVGHGRDTQLVWDGEEGGRMFRSNGAAYSRYVGLSWDGGNKAAVGFDHASEKRFETEVRHEHEAFRNFTGYGIRIGNKQVLASAEIEYLNCLFENCGVGVGMLTFNDYDNTFDGCEFRNCGTGLYDDHGNFYARNCHFERSRDTDFFIFSEHGDSIRRCTSQGSRRFITENGTIAPVVVQDCHVAGWTDPQGAVHLNGSPVLMFDCAFSEPPSPSAPVRMVRGDQKLIISQNRVASGGPLVAESPGASVAVIPPGKLGGVVRNASQSFLRSNAPAAGKVFDVKRDFGAQADGKADDTEAIQAATDAARAHGRGAIAYLPWGTYIVTRSLRVTGADYALAGSGFLTRLVWRGPETGSTIDVLDPQDVTLADFAVGHHDLGPIKVEADIRQSSAGRASRITYDGVYAYGMYQKQPGKQGILFDRLPPGSIVYGIHVQGNLRFRDSARATALMANSYEGTVSIEGAERERDGFLGFMTRLATISSPTLHVRDNHSVVMSDFYIEQSDRHLLLEGNPGDPPGHVTIQGAKMHLNTNEPLVEIHNYAGRVFLGSDEFYIEPKQPRLIATGDAPLELLLVGHFLYNVTPQFALSPSVHLTLIENQGLANAGLDRPEALQAAAAALDDLRLLGRVDHEMRGWLKESR
jgi:Pectate lyase superfamily protein/Right handed beta helix region